MKWLYAIAVALELGAGTAFADVAIQAGGATFPNPIYQEWIKDFGQLHPDIKIAYAAKGSGGDRRPARQNFRFLRFRCSDER